VSAEEIRWEAYQARAANAMPQHVCALASESVPLAWAGPWIDFGSWKIGLIPHGLRTVVFIMQ
jgi:hypothetical protein